MDKKKIGTLKEFISDVLILAGCCGIVYGTWLINPIAAWIVAGILCIIAGYLLGMEAK